jgi:biopolymer transport protein ExbB/TolQ
MAESKNTHLLRGKVVSHSFVACLYVCAAVLVVLNGVTCGLAGYEQGESGTDALLAALAYAFGEGLLLLFAYLTVPAMIGRAAGFAVCWALFALSVWASATFYCSQQYAAEHAGTESLRSEMTRLEEQRGKLDITQIGDRGTIQKLSNRIEEASRELRKSEASGVGASGNAIYKFTARTVGVSVETVILAIRLAWSMTFALAAISLGSYIHSVRRVEQASERSHNTKERSERARVGVAETEEEEIPVLHFDAPARHRARRSEDGSDLFEHLYQRVKAAVKSGEVKPSVAKIKKLAKGTDNAYIAIDRLIKEGVIFQSENGRYQLASA